MQIQLLHTEWVKKSGFEYGCDEYMYKNNRRRLVNRPDLLHFYGVKEDGTSVALVIDDFYPSVIVPKSASVTDRNSLIGFLKWYPHISVDMIREVYEVAGKSIMGYGQSDMDCLKVHTINSSVRYKIKDAFDGKVFNFIKTPMAEFMIEKGIKMCGWVEILDGTKTKKGGTEFIVTSKNNVNYLPEKNDMAPIQIMAIDIETITPSDGSFPSAAKQTEVYVQKHVDSDFELSDLQEAGDDTEEFEKNVKKMECVKTCKLPTQDKVIQISVVVYFLGKDDGFDQYIFMLEEDGNKTTKLPPAPQFAEVESDFDPTTCKVFSYETELDMLYAYAKFIRDKNPDILTGYNICNFDNTYLLDRLNALTDNETYQDMPANAVVEDRYISKEEQKNMQKQMGASPNWCRPSLNTEQPNTHWIENVFQSNQTGKRVIKKTVVTGRVVLDMLLRVSDTEKMNSYKLDDVAYHFLKDKKVGDVPYSEIPTFQKTQKGREQLAIYCVKDSWLVIKLIQKLSTIESISEMCRVTGVSMDDILYRGQQIRFVSLIYHQTQDQKPIPLIPFEMHASSEKLKGAAVLDAKAGFYKKPVATLDFASLYPSIMRACNMCYTTLATEECVRNNDLVENVDYKRIYDYSFDKKNMLCKQLTGGNCIFITEKKQKCILPQILSTLLSERSKVKKQMKTEGDSFRYTLLNAKQLALKVVANSVYGVLGAKFGMPCNEISASITRYGRGLLMQTKDVCENKFGHEVVYGDTDSVFVHLKMDRASAEIEAEKMADFCTKYFDNHIELEYEKVYHPLLLLKKKKYCGMKYEPGRPTQKDIKGIETTKRDRPLFVRSVMTDCIDFLFKDWQYNPQNIEVTISTKIRTTIGTLLSQSMPVDQLAICKKLSKDVQDYTTVSPHVAVAIRHNEKHPEAQLRSSARIHYVFKTGLPRDRKRDRACFADDLVKNGFDYDAKEYISQLRSPIETLLVPHVLSQKCLKMIFHNPRMCVKKKTAATNPIMKRMIELGKSQNKRVSESMEERKQKISKTSNVD